MGLRIQVYVQAGARTQIQMPYILACVQEWDILVGVQEHGISWLACVQGAGYPDGCTRTGYPVVCARAGYPGVCEGAGCPGGCAGAGYPDGNPPDWRYCQINSIIIDYREQSVLIEWVVWV